MPRRRPLDTRLPAGSVPRESRRSRDGSSLITDRGSSQDLKHKGRCSWIVWPREAPCGRCRDNCCLRVVGHQCRPLHRDLLRADRRPVSPRGGALRRRGCSCFAVSWLSRASDSLSAVGHRASPRSARRSIIFSWSTGNAAFSSCCGYGWGPVRSGASGDNDRRINADMYATIGWLVLLGASILIEAYGRFRSARTSSLARLGALLATRIPGRVVLLLIWVFVGVHLFARYTLSHHS